MTLKQWIFVLMAGLVLPGMGFGQVDEELSKKYPVDLGNLKLSTNYVNFKYIKDTEVKADSILIYNNWDQSMEIAPVSLPSYLKVTVNPATLAPGASGSILIEYSGVDRRAYGFQRYSMGLKTNDPKLLVKTIPVNAYIEEDFSGLTEEERANPPVIKVESSRFDFGKVTTGSKVSHDFIIRNEGTRDLVIRSTKASCGCTAIKPEKSVLAPGESSKVGIVFDTRGRTGKQHKTVTVITNDPSNHTVTLHVEGIVE